MAKPDQNKNDLFLFSLKKMDSLNHNNYFCILPDGTKRKTEKNTRRSS